MTDHTQDQDQIQDYEYTDLIRLVTYVDVFEGVTKEEAEDEDFNWDGYDTDFLLVEEVKYDGETLWVRDSDEVISGDFSGVAVIQQFAEMVKLQHMGPFDIAKLTVSEDGIVYDGEECDMDHGACLSEKKVAYVDGKQVGVVGED